jgi:hypothetical protein
LKPLRDEVDSTDPLVRKAARLLGHVGPLERAPERERRIERKRRSRTPLQALAFARPLWMLAVFFGAVTAAATVGGGWRRVRERLFWPASTVTALYEVRPPPEREPIAPNAQAPSPPAAEPNFAGDGVAVRTEDRSPRQPDSERHTSGQKAATGRPSGGASVPSGALSAGPPATPPAAATGPGAALVIEAMKARRTGDPARAARLLNEYRTKYPDGALQEEALVLSIEAAASLGDASVGELARTYLTLFPNGRFGNRVERVLGR